VNDLVNVPIGDGLAHGKGLTAHGAFGGAHDGDLLAVE
jgi:hypothetical protein